MLYAVRFCPHCFSIYTSQVDYCGIDGTKLRDEPKDPLVGRVLDRYRVLERLGLGAMGCVYRVAHTFLEHEYAMKVLFGDLSANRRIVERFRREAQVISKIRHPNVISVTDFGSTQNGLTFLVMEYVAGRTLADIIAEEAPFTPTRAATLARQIAAGLGEAHRQSFIHRDVKPSNIMVWTDGTHEYVKILDFGIVGFMPKDPSIRITGSDHFVGTPLYMAPEQSRDPQNITPAADLYGLGIILYELLAGKPPFDAPNVVDLFIQHATAPIPPLPGSQGLELLVHWLLEKRADRRPPNAEAVIAELDRLAGARTGPPRLRAALEFQPALDATTLDQSRDGPLELPEVAEPTSVHPPARPYLPYPEPEPTPALPVVPIPYEAVGGTRPADKKAPVNFAFLWGRLDALVDRLAAVHIGDETRVILETRSRRLRAALRTDVDGGYYQRLARDIGDLERDLNAAVGLAGGPHRGDLDPP